MDMFHNIYLYKREIGMMLQRRVLLSDNSAFRFQRLVSPFDKLLPLIAARVTNSDTAKRYNSLIK